MGASRDTDDGSHWASAISCLAYSFCSISMVLANKTVLSKYDFEYPVVLLFAQNGIAVILVVLAKKIFPTIVKFDRFDLQVAIDWLPVNLLFIAMLMTGFLSLKRLAVPMVTIFKNLTNIIILGGDWYFHGATVTTGIAGSVFVMLIGAVLAAKNDVEFNAAGYFWMGANCFSTAAYVLYMNGKSKTVNLTKWGMVFYNNVISLPILLPVALFTGEIPSIFSCPLLFGESSTAFMMCVVFSGAVGFFLNLASFWCNQTNSATTYAIVGALNKIPLLLLGAVLFSAVITAQQWTYICLSMCGGFLYSYSKFMLKKAEDASKAGLLPLSRQK